jgi:hypothetical protein
MSWPILASPAVIANMSKMPKMGQMGWERTPSTDLRILGLGLGKLQPLIGGKGSQRQRSICYRPGNSIGFDLLGRPIPSFEVESTPLGRGFGSDLKYRALSFQGHVEMKAKGLGYGRGGCEETEV